MDWTIKDIENLTPMQLETFAEFKKESIKGHDVYFGELGCFGHSAIVCADGRQIRHANEYQLHYPESRYPTVGDVHEKMVEKLHGKLFTEDELEGECESYAEFLAKKHFIANYFGDRREHQSIFCYTEPAEWYQREKETAILNPVTFAYYHDYDEWFVERCKELYANLCRNNDPLRDYEHAKEAFKYEMYNHEYAINCQGDWDVINCFCKVEYEGDGSEIEQTPWNDEVKRAYRDAAHEVTRNADY